ncbi:MAG: hypothetical protein ABI809_04165 [Caldimonas sp.]
MSKKLLPLLLAALGAAAIGTSVAAAEAMPPADPTKPVTTARIGGSPADAAFRAAQQESAAMYRDARAACRAKPREERGACMNAARSELKHAQLESRAAHDAAKGRPTKR